MGMHILLADSREYFRRRLRDLFSSISIVKYIYETSTIKGLKNYLDYCTIDLLIIHQSLITDIGILPRGHFIIIAQELNRDLLKITREQGACGYLLEDPSVESLRVILDIAQKEGKQGFFLDPNLASDLLDVLFNDDSTSIDLRQLTPVEKNILYLMHDDLSYAKIAERLSIATVTVRSHVHNISKKLGISRRQMMRLKLPENKHERES